MKNIAIVVIAYNRLGSLTRLLTSLEKASYSGKNVPLIISIDNSGSKEVATYAHNFKWPFGEKKVIEHPNRLGLRKHVLYCGNLTNNYDAAIVLEDDLIVSRYFFEYAYQSVEKYDSCNQIAGISLYTHLWNVGVNRPFIPQYNGKDAYFLQYAQSWGQVWTKRMWTQFYSWYCEREGDWNQNVELPSNVKSWPESSWLKYFISYVRETKRYFVYPYISLTSNFTDVGTHNKVTNTSYQVPLLSHEIKTYNLPAFSDESLRYDVFFECENLYKYLGLSEETVCIDIYGDKCTAGKKRYWLTSKQLDYKILKSYQLQLKPHELNVIYDIEGRGIYLYDTFLQSKTNTSKKENEFINVSKVRYDIRAIGIKELLSLIKYEVKEKIKRKLKI